MTLWRWWTLWNILIRLRCWSMRCWWSCRRNLLLLNHSSIFSSHRPITHIFIICRAIGKWCVSGSYQSTTQNLENLKNSLNDAFQTTQFIIGNVRLKHVSWLGQNLRHLVDSKNSNRIRISNRAIDETLPSLDYILVL